MGVLKSSVSFLTGIACGIYVAQNYNVPDVRKLASTAIFLANLFEENQSDGLSQYWTEKEGEMLAREEVIGDVRYGRCLAMEWSWDSCCLFFEFVSLLVYKEQAGFT
ncbi:hypothetical protein NL676_016317 [Syzygium grande]|nr:hypothetical protein NL676_016317 [Syzygium grande]